MPGDATSKLLLAAARDKARIEVRGHTDGRQASPGETLIATGRAARARSWLVSHGAQPEFIRTRIYVVGHHLADNATEQGRSLNRRVELEITRDANKVPGMPRPVSNAIRLNTPTIGDAA